VLWQDLELTFEGHEFIEAVRDENTWEANKRKAKSLALSDLVSAQKIERDHALQENKKIFLVHGHDEGMKHSVARFIKDVGLVPIILSEQPNKGATIIEKFERNSDVAVVLLSGDDVGGKTASDLKGRARQNVIMELGYFMGRLSRSRVCALKKDEVEIPSDILGVAWVAFDVNDGWKIALASELKAAGYTIDLNKVVNP
jgi:predicted nucleotide-binding protein